MALPIAHSMIGLALGIWRFVPICAGLKEALHLAWNRRVELFFCIILANAPDVDFLFGVFSGNLNRYHQVATHSLGWILAAALLIWIYGALALKNHPGLAFWFVFLLLASHLVIDIVTVDTSPPFGIMMAWPFSDQYWHSPLSIFPAPTKKTFSDICSIHNLKNAGWEFVITLPFVAAALLSKSWRWPGNKGANIGGKKLVSRL